MVTTGGVSWLLAGTAAVLGVVQIVPYVISILAGRTRPSRVGHRIWAIVELVTTITYLAAGGLTEHVSMQLASRLGLPAAHTQYRTFGSEDAVVITRFDRQRTGDGQVERLHQEDLCQASGQAQKYEDQGGPSAVNLIELLRDSAHTSAQARDNVSLFVDGLIFNTVIAAPDAHARNYAVLLGPQGPRMAPLFDVATGLAYDQPANANRILSMSVGGTFRAGEVDAEAWRRFAGEARLDENLVLERVLELAERAGDEIGPIFDELAELDGAKELRDRIGPALKDHCGTITDRIATSRRHQFNQSITAVNKAPIGNAGRIWRASHLRAGRPVAGHWVRKPKK